MNVIIPYYVVNRVFTTSSLIHHIYVEYSQGDCPPSFRERGINLLE